MESDELDREIRRKRELQRIEDERLDKQFERDTRLLAAARKQSWHAPGRIATRHRAGRVADRHPGVLADNPAKIDALVKLGSRKKQAAMTSEQIRAADGAGHAAQAVSPMFASAHTPMPQGPSVEDQVQARVAQTHAQAMQWADRSERQQTEAMESRRGWVTTSPAWRRDGQGWGARAQPAQAATPAQTVYVQPGSFAAHQAPPPVAQPILHQAHAAPAHVPLGLKSCPICKATNLADAALRALRYAVCLIQRLCHDFKSRYFHYNADANQTIY